MLYIQKRRIQHRLQKYKFTLVTKYILKLMEILMKNRKKSKIYTLFWKNSFKVHFVTKVSLYFWNLRKILRLWIPIKSMFDKNWPLCTLLKRSIDLEPFYCYFPYFFMISNKSPPYSCASSNIDLLYCINVIFVEYLYLEQIIISRSLFRLPPFV
jgi:hypothetical protein